MSYRSQVGIAMSKETHKEMMNKLSKPARDLLTEFQYDEGYVDCNIVCLRHEYIKWDTAYGNVMEIVNYLNTLEDNVYGLIELGEDWCDNNTMGNPWDFGLTAERQLVF